MAEYQAKLQAMRRAHRLSTDIVTSVRQRYKEPREWFLRHCSASSGKITQDGWKIALQDLIGARERDAASLFKQGTSSAEMTWR